ncbi:MAG TPA: hypothetical protein VIV11_36755 [Kofleriaceae bacterium]
MKFDIAIQALSSAAWEWSVEGFALVAATLGLALEPDADEETPVYESPWGKEWAQAIVEEGHVDRIEFLVEDTSPRWRPFTMKKLVALEKKYRAKHAAYLTRASKVLGDPAFVGDSEARGFPDDEDAHLLAMWKRDSVRIMLMARNEGPDTPFWISIVVKPPLPRAPTARASRPAMRPPTRANATALSGTKFTNAIEAIRTTRWDWSPTGLATIVEKLPMPANVGDDRIELAIEKIPPPSDGFSDDEMGEHFGDYCDKYRFYVERAEQILGRPKFNDGMDTKGFPRDEKAQLLALWKLKTARVMVIFHNESERSPYTISIVVRPP